MLIKEMKIIVNDEFMEETLDNSKVMKEQFGWNFIIYQILCIYDSINTVK